MWEGLQLIFQICLVVTLTISPSDRFSEFYFAICVTSLEIVPLRMSVKNKVLIEKLTMVNNFGCRKDTVS